MRTTNGKKELRLPSLPSLRSIEGVLPKVLKFFAP